MRRPVAQVGDTGSIKDWFNSLPLVTKIFLVSTLLSGALLTFNFVNPHSFILSWELIINKFHFWRLFTPFIFAGGFSFNFALHTYVLFENCKRYEANPYNTGAGGSSADFLWMIIFSMGVLLTIGYFFQLYILSESILYVIMYVWSRREPDAMLNIFGFKFKSLYLPWVYVAIRLIMGGSITESLIGIAVGHLYFFLIEVMPSSHGINLVRTPKFCEDIVSYYTGMSSPSSSSSFYANPSRDSGRPTSQTTEPDNGNGTGLRYRGNRSQPLNSGSYNWGRGQVLGTN